MRKLGISLIALLFLNSCGIKTEQIPANTQDSATNLLSEPQILDLKVIIKEESNKLDGNYNNNPDYLIWKTNKYYSGSWREGYKLKIGYIDHDSAINTQTLSSLRFESSRILKEDIDSQKQFKDGISFGDAMLAQEVIIKASIAGILPKLNGIGYTTSTSTLKILINNRSDIPYFYKILELLNIDKNSVIFEVNKFIPLGDLFTSALSSDKTGNSPLRAGGFIKTDADTCSVGGFAKDPNGNLGFVTALHCFKTRNAAVVVKMSGDGTNIGSATRYSQDIDAAFVQISTKSYNTTVINGTPRAYVQGDTAGTTVSATESDPWREVALPSNIYGDVQIHGGMTGLSNMKSKDWTNFRQISYQSPTGNLISNVMCNTSPKLNTFKGDSGGAVTDDKKNTIGIVQSVTTAADINNNFSYCIVTSGEIKRSLGITF